MDNKVTAHMDYRGEVGVILWNVSGGIQPLNQGDRICQLGLRKTEEISWVTVDEISETERGDGGYGSTGTSATTT